MMLSNTNDRITVAAQIVTIATSEFCRTFLRLRMVMIFALIMSITSIGYVAVANAKVYNFGDWTGVKGGDYRFVEHYAISRDARDNVPYDFDVSKQRFDFTYSRKHGWEFYITLHLVPNIDPVHVTLVVDSKSFQFEGTSPFGKMSWEAKPEFLDAMKNTTQPVIVYEVYSGSGGFKYSAEVSIDGLAAALDWVDD